MPNTKEFNIYIHLDDLPNESAMAGDNSKQTSETAESDKSASTIKSVAKKIVGYAALKSTADQIISGQISRVELQTGASEYESRLQAGYNIGNKVFNAGVALGIGAATGTLPIVLAGMVVGGVQQLISYNQRRIALGMQENLENASIDLMNIRAGTAGRRGRDQ